MNKKFHPADIDFFLEENGKLPSTPPPRLVSDYIEGRRIMPSMTPFPGPYEAWRTQYAVEPMNNMSPSSPIKYTDIMAAAQIMKSVVIENAGAYYMDAKPSPILFVTGTDALLEKWGPKRLEPLIDSIGMRHKIHAYNENKKARASGDKARQKLFTGGFLEMASAQSPASLRADSVMVLLLDEIDSAPAELVTGEGRFDMVAEVRTSGYELRKKILAASTPTTFELSLIYKRYSLGDQRRYLVPCPRCSKEQILERGSVTGSHGLREETKAGETQYIYYICDFCHNEFFEYHKNQMIPRGRWEPTAKGSPHRRSYQLGGLYAALGMFSWLSYWNEYQEAQIIPDGMRSFTMLRDGMPYKESGHRPKLEKVIELRGGYNAGTVPDDVLYITIGIDVQEGKLNDDKQPQRLELEILGIGSAYRTYSIDYKIIPGSVKDAYSGAWEKLHEWAMSGGLNFNKKSGFIMNPVMIFIDSGYEQSTVFNFIKRWNNTYASKGQSKINRKKGAKIEIDEAGPLNLQRYRASKSGGGTLFYLLSTNHYKNHIYNNLNIERQDTERQRPGFCDFPINYREEHFKQLTAEEKLTNGDFYLPRGRQNERLDCRVYALCAGDVYLDAKVLEHKAFAKHAGATPDEVHKINHRFVIDRLEMKNKATLIVV